MKQELPILFSDPMVLAIVRRQKWQTRRTRGLEGFTDRGRVIGYRTVKGRFGVEFGDSIPDDPVPTFVPCPYGGPGGGLWVREAWAPAIVTGSASPFVYRATPPVVPPDRWRIHMPRAACRIELEVKDVRVERLQEITESDAIAEGIRACVPAEPGHSTPVFTFDEVPALDVFPSAIAAYRELWARMNGQTSWATNPFVWVIEFSLSASGTGRT